jgi:hypothetical protein
MSSGMVRNWIFAFAVVGALASIVDAAGAIEAPVLMTAASAGSAESGASQTLDASNANASLQGECREREVEVDEGYGISSRERRFVCDHAN